MIMSASEPTRTSSSTTTPNDIIESMTGRRHLSWSQLSSFRGCPRRWFFSHVEGLKPDFTSSALLLGSAVHSAIQFYYERRLEGQGTTLTKLYDHFRGEWHSESDGLQVRYSKNEDEMSAKDLGCRMLEAFLNSELATLGGDVIAIEETLAGSIHPEMPDLLARIDIAWQSDDGVHLMDFKTSKSRWSQAKVNESTEQLLMYQKLATQLAPDQTIHLHFGVITKAKSPAVQQLNATKTIRSEFVAEVMLPVWHAMKSGVDYPSPSPMSCSGCGYRSVCPAHRD